MPYLSSEFQDRATTIKALHELKSTVLAKDLDIFSGAPLDIPRDALDRRSRMSLAVVLGAITACLLIISFVYYTQHNYPLITGGMPIFSFWATGIVFYEITMLGATLTSLFWFLHESGLLRRRRHAPPAYAKGNICLRIHCPPGHEQSLRSLLESAGAHNVRTEA